MYYHIAGWVCLGLSFINTMYAVKKNKMIYIGIGAVLMIAAWINLSI